ncbi:MAG: radical SAM protein [Thermodesulfobacteriota bacterium]
MKLVLLQPPIQDFYHTEVRLIPLGLAYLQAAVKKHLPGVEVTIKDFHHGRGRRTAALPRELDYLGQYWRQPDQSPFSTFHQYFHFGADFETLAREVAAERPDLVGISCLFTPYFREALAAARTIKKHWPAFLVMGGHHVTAAPLSVLSDPNVDFIIRGEGERPLVELLSALMDGRELGRVPNLGYKTESGPVLNPREENYPLAELPWPDLSDLPPERYLYQGQPLCSLTVSRGCPHHCAFCSVHLTFGHEHRRRQPEDVVEEILRRLDQGYRVFDFEDDNLSWDRPGFMALLRTIIARLTPGRAAFTAMNGLSYPTLDREMLALMKRAGFLHLDLSLVSASGLTLWRLDRPHTLDRFLEVIQAARDLDFRVTAYQIIGLPHEDLETISGALALLTRLPVFIGASIFYLPPGCALAAERPAGDEADFVKARSTALAIETEHFSRDDLYTLFITSRIVNFLKGLPTGSGESTLAEALTAAEKKGSRSRLGAEILRRLIKEKRLYAAVRRGREPLPRFKADLFFQVLGRAGRVASPAGGEIKWT